MRNVADITVLQCPSVAFGRRNAAGRRSAKTDVTAQQLLQLKSDGMGWGQIAAGLGFDLGSAMRAVSTEGHVAMGTSRASGKVAVIHGEGARAGMETKAGLNAGMHGKGVSASAGAGVGVKVGH